MCRNEKRRFAPGVIKSPPGWLRFTVDVKPGRNVIFDSYRNNRRKGFRTKLIVEAPAQ